MSKVTVEKSSRKPLFYVYMYRSPTKKEIRQLVMFGVSCVLGILAVIATAKLEDRIVERDGHL